MMMMDLLYERLWRCIYLLRVYISMAGHTYLCSSLFQTVSRNFGYCSDGRPNLGKYETVAPKVVPIKA